MEVMLFCRKQAKAYYSTRKLYKICPVFKIGQIPINVKDFTMNLFPVFLFIFPSYDGFMYAMDVGQC